MLKTNFLHIAITVILISIYPWLETLTFEIQLQITLVMVFLLGIPHGAIDHVLLRKKHQSKNDQFKFYSFYLGLIAIYTYFLDCNALLEPGHILFDFFLPFWTITV